MPETNTALPKRPNAANSHLFSRHGMTAGSVLLACLWAVPAGASDAPTDWPQWRGPTRDGFVHPSSPAWPESLKSLEPVWRVELGAPSYSGPTVCRGMAFTTATRDRASEQVIALDLASGREIWRVEWPGAMSVPFFAASRGSWIRATPACDGETLYVAGIRDVVVALDVRDGQERWRVDFPQALGTPPPDFGFVSSPLIDGDALYVQAGASFQKLDRKTGQTIWRSLEDGGGMYGSAFSSPIVASIAGRRQLVVQSRTRLAGVDPADGAVLWAQEVPSFRGMNILTPLVSGSTIFTSTHKNNGFLYEVEPADGAARVVERWRSRSRGYMSSPVLIDGHAFLHLENQRFACIDLRTGQERWRTTPFGKYWSLVANRDRILALDERGELLLIRANPEKFELLDRRKPGGDDAWAHLAVAGDLVIIRELNALAAYRWR